MIHLYDSDQIFMQFLRADGKYGQYCIVVPKKNAVVAINSMQIEDEKKVLRAAVKTVLPLL